MMTKEVSTKIVNFMTPVSRVIVIGRGPPDKSCGENASFPLKTFFSTLGHGSDKLNR